MKYTTVEIILVICIVIATISLFYRATSIEGFGNIKTLSEITDDDLNIAISTNNNTISYSEISRYEQEKLNKSPNNIVSINNGKLTSLLSTLKNTTDPAKKQSIQKEIDTINNTINTENEKRKDTDKWYNNYKEYLQNMHTALQNELTKRKAAKSTIQIKTPLPPGFKVTSTSQPGMSIDKDGWGIVPVLTISEIQSMSLAIKNNDKGAPDPKTLWRPNSSTPWNLLSSYNASVSASKPAPVATSNPAPVATSKPAPVATSKPAPVPIR
jgi:hypothetical protein